MPVNRKALLEDMQKVLQEHEVGSAVMTLDLFDNENTNNDGRGSEGHLHNSSGDAPTSGQIKIYLEEHVDPPRSGLGRGGGSERDGGVIESFSRSNANTTSGTTVSLPPTSCRCAKNGNPAVSKKNYGKKVEDERDGQEGVVLPQAVPKYSHSASSTSPKKTVLSSGSSALPSFLQKDVTQMDEIRRVHAKEVAEKEREAERVLPVAEMFRTPPPSHNNSHRISSPIANPTVSSTGNNNYSNVNPSVEGRSSPSTSSSSNGHITATIACRNAEPLMPLPKEQPFPRLPHPSPEENSNHILSRPRSYANAEEDDLLRTNTASREARKEEEDAKWQAKESRRTGGNTNVPPHESVAIEPTTTPPNSPHAETLQKKNVAGMEKETAPPQLQFSDDVLRMLGLGGSGGGHPSHGDDTETEGELSMIELQQKRAERTRLLKSWVGKSTLLDYSKAKEKAERDPPRQFLSQKLSGTPPLPAVLQNDNLASSKMDSGTVLEAQSWMPPAPSDRSSPSTSANPTQPHSNSLPHPQDSTGKNCSTSPVPPRSTSTTSKDTLNYLRQPSPPAPMAPPTATPRNKSLKELLEEQRVAEAKNKEGLQKHATIMKECKEYLNDVENDPERNKLVEVVHNPLTKKTSENSRTPQFSPTRPPGVPQQAGASTENGKKAAIREQLDAIAIPTVNGDAEIVDLTLPENPEAREVVIKQFLSSPDGRALLSKSAVKFDTILSNQVKSNKLSAEKEKTYKELLEAAVRYNASLGVREGKP